MIFIKFLVIFYRKSILYGRFSIIIYIIIIRRQFINFFFMIKFTYCDYPLQYETGFQDPGSTWMFAIID
jgi:hypothetical protein